MIRFTAGYGGALAALFIWFGVTSTAFGQTGSIAGTIVDSETGETLIGANVVVDGTSSGSTTDLDGHYVVRSLEPGTYTLGFSYIGYSSKTVTGVDVRAGETSRIDLTLAPEAIGLDEVIVEARALENTEAALLRQRQRAAGVSDAISAEAIGRSGSSTAADAMQMVTGVSVVGGSYVYVRGLGDRYTNTRLNGATLPSADPDRNSVQLDLFPANLLDHIVTTKTFTPDKPGSFSGGSVDIATKSFPEALTVSFSSSLSQTGGVGPGGAFLSYQGGEAGWLGDNGARSLPEALKDPNVAVPDVGAAFTDSEAAQELDRLSESFNGVMAPSRVSAPLSQSYSFSLGNQLRLLGRPLGVVASLSYSRSAREYADGTVARYQLTGSAASTDELTNDFLLTDRRGTDEVLWGALLNAGYKPHPKHEVGVHYLRNESGESGARYQSGPFPRDLSSEAVYETRTLQYVARTLDSYQAHGEHLLFGDGELRIEWSGTLSNTAQDEPDLRFFTNNFTPLERNGTVDTVYTIRPSVYPVPTRYFRTMDERGRSVSVGAALPFRQRSGRPAQLKAGGSFERKVRTFRERRFEFRQDRLRYDGNEHTFFDQDHVGLLEHESTERFYRFGNYVIDVTQPSSNYDGRQDILAVYALIDLPVSRRLRAIGGLRLETTDMRAYSADASLDEGTIDTQDFLPSMNLIYEVGGDMNLRFGYGRTLARPTFREIAPFASFSFVGDYIFIGNTDLHRTLIDNYDLRWEWFIRPGEIAAVSGFYKHFRHPIERAFNPTAAASNPNIQFQNVDNAQVFGVELEARTQLDGIARFLDPLQIGANASFVRSSVDIQKDELELIRALRPDAPSTRSLQGQSPYTINLDLTYENLESGTTASLYYNVFGPRLDRVAVGGTPNVYERPRHLVDWTFGQRLFLDFSLRASVQNLLDAKTVFSHAFKGTEFVAEEYGYGRSFSLGVRYDL